MGLLILLTGSSCSDILLDDRMLVINAFGRVEGTAFLDLDGNGGRSTADEPFPGLKLNLVVAGSGATVRSTTSGLTGAFQLDSVPVGSFRLVVDPAVEPDSVDILGLDQEDLIVFPDSIYTVDLLASFPTYGLAQVRGLAPGIRLITHGIALNSRPTFGDGVVHLQEGNAYLRAIEVERSNISAGDSVRFIGRTAMDAGQPILEDVRPFELVSQAAFIEPVDVSSADAAAASSGALDAAIVRILGAVIEDTVTVGNDLIVTADDGSGPVDLVLRNFIGFNRALIKPDSTFFVQATGLLVPRLVGPADVLWRMTPRAQSDLTVQNLPAPTPVP